MEVTGIKVALAELVPLTRPLPGLPTRQSTEPITNPVRNNKKTLYIAYYRTPSLFALGCRGLLTFVVCFNDSILSPRGRLSGRGWFELVSLFPLLSTRGWDCFGYYVDLISYTMYITRGSGGNPLVPRRWKLSSNETSYPLNTSIN